MSRDLQERAPQPSRFYVLALEGGQEYRTRDRLDRDGWQIWLPLCESQERRRARNVLSVEPLYPGYGFVQLERPREAMDALRETPGVLGLVNVAGAFGWLSTERVVALMALAAPDGLIRFKRAIELVYQPGNRVRVRPVYNDAGRLVNASLAGLIGDVLTVKSGDRVKLMLGSLRTEVPAGMLERV